MNKDNLILTFFIVMALYSLVSVYGAIKTDAIAWTHIFTLCVAFMGLGMMFQKMARIY